MTEQNKVFFGNDQKRGVRVLEELAAAYARLQEKPERIWVACSGGLDSVCLLASLLHLKRAQAPSIQVHLAHVNYGLRGAESDQDESFVRDLAQKWDVPCHVLKVDQSEHPPGLKGIQESARDKRYAWFESLRGPKDLIALAHHEGDLIENILMRLCRGAGLKDLLGMEELRTRYWRPFLQVGRAELEHFVSEENIPFRVDSSNSKLIYTRNRVRLQILPLLEEIYPGLRQNLRTLAQDARDSAQFGLEISSTLPLAQLLQVAPPTVVMQQIEDSLRRNGYRGPISRTQLTQIYEGLKSGNKLTVPLQTRVKVRVESGEWSLEHETFPLSERWKQYRGRLLGRNGLVKIAGGSRYVAAGSLEESGRIVDNERSEPDLAFSESEIEEV